jgi:hypothetical protein
MCLPFDLAALIWYPYHPTFLGVIVVFGLAFGPGALGLILAVRTLNRRKGLRSALPLVVVTFSAILLFTVNWTDAYLRTVWLLHQRQYAVVVAGLQSGRLTVDQSTSWVVERTPTGPADADRPLALSNTGDDGPLPNLYFHVYGGSLLDWRMFGILYTTADAKTIRAYWNGTKPDWTPLKTHWYIVRN